MNNNDSGSNLALWLPGSAIVISLVLSTFALTREPFLEQRPFGAQFQAELPIDARLWQDPFDALERYRKKLNGNKGTDDRVECNSVIHGKPVVAAVENKTQSPPLPGTATTPPLAQVSKEPTNIMVALVEGGPYADEVEKRRRMRYAILAGFKNARMVPEDEQHIGCLDLTGELPGTSAINSRVKIPYEIFVANPFDPPTDINEIQLPTARTILFWVKQEYLGSQPLQKLEDIRQILSYEVSNFDGSPLVCNVPLENRVLKVIGPATSTVLRDMYHEEFLGVEKPNIEIYSPLATADRDMLRRGFDTSSSGKGSQQQAPRTKETMKLLRTVSDDRTMTDLLLNELKLRRVDPVAGLQCTPGAAMRVGRDCDNARRPRANRIALISEWDSFYSRALIESFKTQVAEGARMTLEKDKVDEWVLRFSYLRGLDGRLPEEAASGDKPPAKDDRKDGQPNLSPQEKSDGNSQLDYLRRLADHIVDEDELYRRKGEPGIGAIGVLGYDAYDKLLVLQAVKARMPNKVYFSTDLDARMLQSGQAQTTRNLVVAAPYGLTLTRALQQDVPPFRDSLQSAVFIAVLTAQAPPSFEAKRVKFDYTKSGLLSPGIYEVGIRGFIPLANSLSDSRPEDCAAQNTARAGKISHVRPQDIMALRCLQDRSDPPYPEASQSVQDDINNRLSYFWAGPLSFILLSLALFLGWWWTNKGSTDEKPEPPQPAQLPLQSSFPWVKHKEKKNDKDDKDKYRLPPWVFTMPTALYAASGLSALIATQYWRVEFMWITFVLILLGVICSELIRRTPDESTRPKPLHAPAVSGLFDSSAWYVVVPFVVFILALLWAYQIRRSLTDDGLGEPMFLMQGISAWPTAALRLLAALISISALAWGWRNLRVNRMEIEAAYHLNLDYQTSLWQQRPRYDRQALQPFRDWLKKSGNYVFKILFPLSSSNIDPAEHELSGALKLLDDKDERPIIFIERFWKDHCEGGTFGARLLRAILATWVFVALTSVLFVVWPMEGIPVRGDPAIWRYSWLIPQLLFQLLVFWVVDANRLLTRFIRQLSYHHAIWPLALRRQHEVMFCLAKAGAVDKGKGKYVHPCVDDWMDMVLIAKRTAAVSRLIYAPTVVLLVMIASRSSYFDNWPTPPSIIISYLLTGAILLSSAFSLRRAAEKARKIALQRFDDYLLNAPADDPSKAKFGLLRERIAALNTGAFSRYSEEPLVRALLLSLTGIGGSIIVDAVNFSKF